MEELERQIETSVTASIASMFDWRPMVLGTAKKLGISSLFFIIRRGVNHLENGVWLLAWRRTTQRVRKLVGGGNRNQVEASNMAEPDDHDGVADDAPNIDHYMVVSARIKAEAKVEASRIAARASFLLSLSLLLLSALILALIVTLAMSQQDKRDECSLK